MNHLQRRNGDLDISSVQSLSRVWLFATPWTATRQASLSFTVSWSLFKLMSIELVMHPTISSSVIPFSCLLSFPALGSFPVSWLFKSHGQSIGASASVLSVNIQGWFPLVLTSLHLLAVRGTLKSLLQHHSSKASILPCSAFFMVQLSYPYMTTGKHIALTIQTVVCSNPQNPIIAVYLYTLA